MIMQTFKLGTIWRFDMYIGTMYINMRNNIVKKWLICVQMQHNYVDKQHNEVPN